MFLKKTIRDIDLKDKTVLLRADYNVPLEKGRITNDYRLKQSLDTIAYLLSQNCRLIICSHLGRPNGQVVADLSLFPVAIKLQELTHHKVEFVPDCIGKPVSKAIAKLRPGHILLLENLRFHPEEEQNDDHFAAQLASLADVFVEDAFGCVHRNHASIVGVPKYLPAVAGLLLEKEVQTITRALAEPQRPLMAIIGGAKIADKLDIISRFVQIADVLAIGGAMANTFLALEGIDVGDSLYDKQDIDLARRISLEVKKAAQQRGFLFILPFDGVVASKIDPLKPTRIVDWSAHAIADIENYPKRPPRESAHIHAHEKILDIGPFSGAFIAGAAQLVKTVIWNGTMGVTETASLLGAIGPYAHGTDLIIQSLTGDMGQKPYTVVGGGDTVGYIENRHLVDHFNLVSTGGGASLELMAGHPLPGVEALLPK